MAPAVVCLALLLAPPPPSAAAVRWPFPPVERVVLDNGLTVLLAPDHSSPLASVAVMYTVGARNEAAGITGLAHYVEHMNFRATRRFPGTEITESITRMGGRWNGYTWIDQTYYAETLHKGALDHMLDLERDRMADALYEPEDFRKERTSVIAELHSYDDPRSVLYDAVVAASFEIHPYRHNTIGWLTDVESVTRDEAWRFYRRFYHPNNAVLAIVGDFEPASALEKVRARFAALPAAGEPTRIRTVEPAQTGERRVTVRRPGPHARVLAAFRAPALADHDFPVLVLLDALMAGGKGFRFTRDYPGTETEPLHRAVAAAAAGATAESQWQASRDPYVYTLAADVPDEAGLAAVEQALFRTVEEAGTREWTGEEMARAQRQVLTGWASDLDDKAGRAHQLAFFEVSGGYAYLLDLPARLARVTRDELNRLARERLTRAQATVGWFVPTAANAPPAAGARPSTAEAAPAPVPVPEDAPVARDGPRAEPVVRRLANGLSLSIAPLSGSALVALRGRIEAGSLFDGGSPGLSALATELLSRPVPGAPTPVTPLSWRLHEEPEAASARRWIEFTASCLAADAPDVVRDVASRLQRAGSIAQGAVVPAAEWEEIRKAAAHRARTNAMVSSTALWQRALGELHQTDSPLGRPAWGDPAAIEAATVDALRAFLRAHVHPGATRLALAGPLDVEATGRTVAGLVQAIPPAAASADPPLAAAQGPPAWHEVRLPQPGKSQDDIRVVLAGDRRQPWDHVATELLMYLLGTTGYAGRLGHALVDPGLVYSVYATLEEEGAPGFVIVRTSAAPRDTPEVLRRIRAHLEQAAAGRFTAADLDEAKTYTRGVRARAREGSLATTRDQLDTPESSRGPAPDAVTLDQLNDTARRLFRNGAPVAIVAGPPMS